MKKILVALALSTVYSNASAFTIHASTSCSSKYAYHMSEYTSFPDVSVKVSEYASFPDVTIKLTSSRYGADVVITDSPSGADLSVCKASSSFGVKSIKVSEYTSFPDITVKISEYASFPDYTLYYDSKIFTLEEAAALAPAIWHLNKND